MKAPRAASGGGHALAVSLVLAALAGCRPATQPPLTVLAASSTREAVEAQARDFEAQAGVSVECQLGATSDLARQLEQGADGDLFLSADTRWADYLEEHGLVEARRDLLANRLVVVVPAASGLTLHCLQDLSQEKVRRLAVALEPVPAGRYARQALKKAGVWQALEPRVLEGGNVRAVLTFVQRDEADAGLVYATDALAARDQVRTVLEVPADLHTPIRYPLVLVRRPAIRPEARRLFDFLGSAAAGPRWKEAGFERLP